jgi:asparagine synthase (glutamine-hydrolysing)
MSIYQGFFKLPQGSLLTLHRPDQDGSAQPYWSLASVLSSRDHSYSDPEETTERLDTLLRDSVSKRLLADVPVGAFLSGGIDSSLVCGVMRAVASGPVKTFSIGFHESGFDEAPFAEKVAAHLETNHTNLYVTPEEAMSVIPDLPTIYDEPFADSSQIPTYLVSRLARSEVTVSLSGDGGDELFGGYDRYDRVLRRWPWISGVPGPVRTALARLAGYGLGATDGPKTVDGREGAPSMATKDRVESARTRRALQILSSDTISEFYRRTISREASAFGGRMLNGSMSGEPVLDVGIVPGLSPLETLSYIDLMSYLPDDILVKVDRASMAVSLEARVPLLDHRLVEFSTLVDPGLKIRKGDRKWLVKNLLSRYVPDSITERPKQGFAIPVGSWIRGPLKSWAEGLLDERALAKHQFFDADAVRAIWSEHESGVKDHHSILWRILMFQAWVDTR